MSTVAAAIRKFLFYDEEDAFFNRTYHLSTSWDTMYLGSCSMARPQTVMPPSSAKVSGALFATCVGSCMLSRNRHQERWWFGGLAMATSYFFAMKFHMNHNGPQGHMLGFWTSLFGMLGFTLRFVNQGRERRLFNGGCLAFLGFLVWYEIGRFHQWCGWWDEFQRTHGTLNTAQSSLWAEFVPRDIKTELLHYRPLHTFDENGEAMTAGGPTSPPVK